MLEFQLGLQLQFRLRLEFEFGLELGMEVGWNGNQDYQNLHLRISVWDPEIPPLAFVPNKEITIDASYDLRHILYNQELNSIDMVYVRYMNGMNSNVLSFDTNRNLNLYKIMIKDQDHDSPIFASG